MTLSYTLQRPDHSDISLALVPRDHPVIPYVSLEAEGHGLLDRLLDIIHGDHRSEMRNQASGIYLTWNSDGLLVTATLNTLGVLMHRRPIAVNKILTSIFNFNPLKLANAPLTPKNKVIMKSIERTTRSLLMNIMKRYVSILLKATSVETHSMQRSSESHQRAHTAVP
jgi:symplekin